MNPKNLNSAVALVSLLIGALISTTVMAAGPTITISSFHQIDLQNPQDMGAEACGSVTGLTLTGQEHVLITVDPNGNPGEYTTLLSPSGNFCQVVSTQTGQVEAALVSPTGQVIAKSLKAPNISRR